MFFNLHVHYERQIKRELKGIHICGYRCNERLKVKTDGSKCLTYTGSFIFVFISRIKKDEGQGKYVDIQNAKLGGVSVIKMQNVGQKRVNGFDHPGTFADGLTF